MAVLKKWERDSISKLHDKLKDLHSFGNYVWIYGIEMN